MLIKEVIEYDSKKKKNRMMEKNTNGWPRLIYWGSVVDPSIWDQGFLLVVTHYYQTIGDASVGLEKEVVEHENHWRYLFFDWFSFVDFAYNVIWAQVGVLWSNYTIMSYTFFFGQVKMIYIRKATLCKNSIEQTQKLQEEENKGKT